MDYDIWMNKVLINIGKLEKGTKFVVKDLFPGVEWNTLKPGEKSHLGRLFKKSIDDHKIPEVIIIDSPKGTATTYQKV